MPDTAPRAPRRFKVPRYHVLNLDKMTVAKRQLEAAILLHFYAGDPVAIHTLACASYNVFRDLAKEKGIKDPLVRIIETAQPDEPIEVIVARARKPQNFFKHADRDRGEKLKFRTATNTFQIWLAERLYKKLGGPRSVPISLWVVWFRIKHPKWVGLLGVPDTFKYDPHWVALVKKSPPGVFYEFMCAAIRAKPKMALWRIEQDEGFLKVYRRE